MSAARPPCKLSGAPERSTRAIERGPDPFKIAARAKLAEILPHHEMVATYQPSLEDRGFRANP